MFEVPVFLAMRPRMNPLLVVASLLREGPVPPAAGAGQASLRVWGGVTARS